MLLEHDAKVLLQEAGVPVPRGQLVDLGNGTCDIALHPPLMVKAQVPVGGRGKAGGIIREETVDDLMRTLTRVAAMKIKGHRVSECRVEEIVDGSEFYVSFSLDPMAGLVDIILSARGGVDVESSARESGVLRESAEFDIAATVNAARRLATEMPHFARAAIADASERLARVFFALEATLIEINPLFVQRNGDWVAGDAKLVVDENAFFRQPRLARLIMDRKNAYPEASTKISEGFDFVVLDRDGDVGLVTTGAGLSMQLIDELTTRGHRPYNFCDIRTGQLRGSPDRLITALRWVSEGPSVRAVLFNFFAGVTDLGELARLLVDALGAVPELRASIIVRLIGNGYDEAISILRMADPPLGVETDLEAAVAAVAEATSEGMT
jgi:succinyl-CoA synthetase beta subunit